MFVNRDSKATTAHDAIKVFPARMPLGDALRILDHGDYLCPCDPALGHALQRVPCVFDVAG
jgi:hypothetical protein